MQTDPVGRLHRDSERFRYRRERSRTNPRSFSVQPRIVELIASGAVLVPLQRRIVASSQQQPEVIEAMRRDGSADISGAALAGASLTLAAMAAAV